MFDYKSLLKKCLLLLSVIVCCFLFFLFRQIPAGKMWDNYSQLYVPVSSDDEVVMKVFSSNQMEGVVSLSNQYLPYSPSVSLKSKLLTSQGDGRSAMSMAALSRSLLADILKDNNYLSLRNLFFFDESKDFRIYYIPENQKKNIPYCISELKNYGI